MRVIAFGWEARNAPSMQRPYPVAGTVGWSIDDDEVFHMDHLGYRIGRLHVTIDQGGIEMFASPRQLDCGMGMFTLLDGSKPSNLGLVRLSSASHFYFNPLVGSPVP